MVCNVVRWDETNCFLSAHNIQHSSSRDNLRDISQPYALFAVPCCAQLHFQALHNIGIQLSSAPQLAQLVCELFDCLEDL
jgi:hypothetical protein